MAFGSLCCDTGFVNFTTLRVDQKLAHQASSLQIVQFVIHKSVHRSYHHLEAWLLRLPVSLVPRQNRVHKYDNSVAKSWTAVPAELNERKVLSVSSFSSHKNIESKRKTFDWHLTKSHETIVTTGNSQRKLTCMYQFNATRIVLFWFYCCNGFCQTVHPANKLHR